MAVAWPAAATSTGPLAWEPSYAAGKAIKKKLQKKKNLRHNIVNQLQSTTLFAYLTTEFCSIPLKFVPEVVDASLSSPYNLPWFR